MWMTIEIDTGVVGDRADNTVYQFVPTTNPAGWHTVDAAAGQWQKWNNNEATVTGNPLISLSDVAAAHTGLNVVRAYLRLGMGDSYHGTGVGTVGWVDKATIGGVTYDFVVGAPTVTSVSPNQGTQGQTLDWCCHKWHQFERCYGPRLWRLNITVSNPVVNATARRSRRTSSSRPTAATGARDVSVTTPGGTGTLTGGFTVRAPDGWCEQATVSNGTADLYGSIRSYQTFTPVTSHYFNAVSLYLYKLGSPTFTATIALYNVGADGTPTGSPLCSTTFAASSLTTTATWYTYAFATGCQVDANTKYAVVLSCDGGNSANKVLIGISTTGGYSRGERGYTTTTTWTVRTDQDWAFKEGQSPIAIESVSPNLGMPG